MIITSQASAPDLAAFQAQFGDYLRRQTHTPADTAPKRVGTLYQSLIFNNLSGFVNQCFPVCQSLLSAETWQALLRAFLQHGAMESPYFSEINAQFVAYLQDSDIVAQLKLPAFFAELVHYEWVELYVDNLPNHTVGTFVQQPMLALNPTLQALAYHWAVHTISADAQPKAPDETFLLVYRKRDEQTAFMQVNALTFCLIKFIQENLATCYDDVPALLDDFARYVGLSDDLSQMADVLIGTMIDNEVFIRCDGKKAVISDE